MQYYIVFSSITYSTWLKRLFIGHGSAVAMLHTPRSIPVEGCSYSLRTSRAMVRPVLNEAKSRNIKVLGVYRDESGDFRPVGEVEFL